VLLGLHLGAMKWRASSVPVFVVVLLHVKPGYDSN